MTRLRNFRDLASDTSGVSTIILAFSMMTLIGASAFAVDMGSLYLAKRKLQGLADTAAMSIDESDYAKGAEGTVNELILEDGSKNVKIVQLVPGTYTPDPAVAPEQRFQPISDPAAATAIKVALHQDVPLFFGAILTRKPTARVHASAISARSNMAAFSIGTRLSNLTGNLPNQVLSSLAGAELNLDTAQIMKLSGQTIDVKTMGFVIADAQNLENYTLKQIFDNTYAASVVVDAMADVASDPQTADMLHDIANRVGNDPVDLSALIDLGVSGDTTHADPAQAITIDAYSLLRATLQLSQGDSYKIEINTSAVGLTSAKLIIAGKNTTSHSPLLTINAAKQLTLRTAATRVFLDTTVSTGASLGSLRVPYYVELAPGEARMTDIECGSDKGVTLGVKPAIGSVALGDIDKTLISDFSTDLTVNHAQLAKTLLVKVEGRSELELGGNREQSVPFSLDEIDAKAIKSVQASDVVSSFAASLASKSDIKVSALGLGVNVSSVTSAVGTTLGLIAPAVDSVLFNALEAAGVKIGVSDVSVDRLRCGTPILVA